MAKKALDNVKRTLKKHCRLAKPDEFHWVYQSKQWGGSALFTYNVRANQEADYLLTSSRLGVTVAKKVSKRAVDRNRLKRQMREFYRHRQDQLINASLVITAKPKSLNASDSEREQSLQELWTKVLSWQHWYNKNHDVSSTKGNNGGNVDKETEKPSLKKA